MGLGIALRAFSAALFDKSAAARIRHALDGDGSQPIEPKLTAPPETPERSRTATTRPSRSDAITLLSALQRDARLIDLIQEKLDHYSDAQVGAAARPCLQQCASTLERLVGIVPVSDVAEGESVDVGADASAARYQWSGEGTSRSGKLVHQGWQATKIELPQWSGDRADANVIAPAQLQRS